MGFAARKKDGQITVDGKAVLQAKKGRPHMEGDLNIVVVDDDQTSREFIESSLDRLSENILVFPDCWSAWMHIKSKCANVVISDVYMSGMNGFDLLRSIKRVYPKTRCIMISADYSTEKSAMKLGADAFLCKPFKAEALIGVVNDLLPGLPQKTREPALK